MSTIGFIGMGNMAQAIAQGLVKNKIYSSSDIYAFAPNSEKLARNSERIGFVPKSSATKVVEASDIVVMACKPYQIESVLDEIAQAIEDKSLVSIALGWDYARYITAFNERKINAESVKVQFVMPNTPAQVGEGVFLFEKTNSLDAKDRMQMMEAFSKLGMVKEMPSHLMGIGGAITGCGPAFIDLFIEAMADAAVKYGVQRNEAYQMVSQTMLGTAKLQLETGEHPAVLKDAVCSPAGSTIRGVTALEATGFRAACQASIDAIMNKN